MIRCWDCNQELHGYTQEDLNRSYDQGYMQAIRDMKNAKIDYADN